MSMIDLPPKENAALLDQVLSRAESRNLEFKRVSGKMVNKALETICACVVQPKRASVLLFDLAPISRRR